MEKPFRGLRTAYCPLLCELGVFRQVKTTAVVMTVTAQLLRQRDFTRRASVVKRHFCQVGHIILANEVLAGTSNRITQAVFHVQGFFSG